MRIAGKGLIDRDTQVTFRFNGTSYMGHRGDTLASALLANEVRLVGRSFKYHRPRGILTAGSEEPNALVEILEDGQQTPNTRATTQEIFDGLEARSQNHLGPLGWDLLAINDLAAPFLSAGFYYKTFMWPRAFWEKLYEPLIRRAAGLGRLSPNADTAPYESIGVNTRGTWMVFEAPKEQQFLHLGAAAAWRTDLKQPSGATTISNAIRLSDRPNVRVDNGNLADTGVITNVDDVTYLGGEFVGVYKSLSLQGEYNRLHATRTLAGLPRLDFDGGYVFASWFPTGESRTMRNGLPDRLRPLHNFSPAQGDWGALELLLRYDWFDFSETPVAARIGNKGHSLTSGFTWYYNPNIKFMFNWVRFAGTNTPLDPVGSRTAGDALAARAHVDF